MTKKEKELLNGYYESVISDYMESDFNTEDGRIAFAKFAIVHDIRMALKNMDMEQGA